MGNYRSVPHFEIDVYVVRNRMPNSDTGSAESDTGVVELLITNTEDGWWTPKQRVSDGGQKHATQFLRDRDDPVLPVAAEFTENKDFIQEWCVQGTVGDRYTYEYAEQHFDNPPAHVVQPVLVTVSRSDESHVSGYKWVPLDEHDQWIDHENAAENTNTISTLVTWHLNNTVECSF